MLVKLAERECGLAGLSDPWDWLLHNLASPVPGGSLFAVLHNVNSGGNDALAALEP